MVRTPLWSPPIISISMCVDMSCFIFRKRAARDNNLAMVLYQNLLENLDIQYSRFVREVAFLQQHNIRRYKQNFQVCATLVLIPVVNLFCMFFVLLII